jgi:hypothetical protein
VPGFSARELPVDLTNVNNVRYRADGKLVALAYDGEITCCPTATATAWRRRSERFWENTGSLVAPIGMALTPPATAGETACSWPPRGRCR